MTIKDTSDMDGQVCIQYIYGASSEAVCTLLERNMTGSFKYTFTIKLDNICEV